MTALSILTGILALAALEGGAEIERLPAGAGEKALALADFNEDGALDLAAANQTDGEVQIYLGDGKGQLTPAGRYKAGSSPNWVETGDVDGDGKTDLVIANHETQYLTLLLGDGKGGFGLSPHSPLSTEVSPHPHMARIADLDRDGIADIIVDSRDRDGLVFMRGTGGGAFRSPGIAIATGGAPYLGFMVSTDDRRIVFPGSGEVTVIALSADDVRSPEKIQTFPLPGAFSAIFADVDGDGQDDIVAASERGRVVAFAAQSESYAADPLFEVRFPGGGTSLAVGDLDGDGVLDIAASSWNGGLVEIIGGDSHALNDGLMRHPFGLVAGDLNGDGHDELIVADGQAPGLYLFRSLRN